MKAAVEGLPKKLDAWLKKKPGSEELAVADSGEMIAKNSLDERRSRNASRFEHPRQFVRSCATASPAARNSVPLRQQHALGRDQFIAGGGAHRRVIARPQRGGAPLARRVHAR